MPVPCFAVVFKDDHFSGGGGEGREGRGSSDAYSMTGSEMPKPAVNVPEQDYSVPFGYCV